MLAVTEEEAKNQAAARDLVNPRRAAMLFLWSGDLAGNLSEAAAQDGRTHSLERFLRWQTSEDLEADRIEQFLGEGRPSDAGGYPAATCALWLLLDYLRAHDTLDEAQDRRIAGWLERIERELG